MFSLLSKLKAACLLIQQKQKEKKEEEKKKSYSSNQSEDKIPLPIVVMTSFVTGRQKLRLYSIVRRFCGGYSFYVY